MFSIASVVPDVVFHRILFLFVCFDTFSLLFFFFLTSTIAPLLEGFDVMLMGETRYEAS